VCEWEWELEIIVSTDVRTFQEKFLQNVYKRCTKNAVGAAWLDLKKEKT